MSDEDIMTMLCWRRALRTKPQLGFSDRFKEWFLPLKLDVLQHQHDHPEIWAKKLGGYREAP